MFDKFRIVSRFRRKNRRSKRVYGERIEDIVLRLVCIRELRNQAECICEFLNFKENQERRRLRYAAPIFTVFFEHDWERYMKEYNVVYDEESEVYYPIPRFLDTREDELQVKLGEFEDVTSAAISLLKKWPEKVRFKVFDRKDE